MANTITTKKYLDGEGLKHLWALIKAEDDRVKITATGDAYVSADVDAPKGRAITVAATDKLKHDLTNAKTTLKTSEAGFIHVTKTAGDPNTGTADSYEITGHDIASATDLGKVNTTSGEKDTTAFGKIKNLEDKVTGLTSATRFLGKYDVLPGTPGAAEGIPTSGLKGDIVIVGAKEYIYNAGSTTSVSQYVVSDWVELGDTDGLSADVTTLKTYFNKSGEVLKVDATEKAAIINGLAKSNDVANTYVAKTTKVNNQSFTSGDITLTGADIQFDGYSKAGASGDVAAADSINAAIAKVEAKADSAISKAGVTSLKGDGKYITTTATTGAVTLGLKAQDTDCTGATSDVVATAKAVDATIKTLDANKSKDLGDQEALTKIVTSVAQTDGRITVTDTNFTVMTNEEIDALLGIPTA